MGFVLHVLFYGYYMSYINLTPSPVRFCLGSVIAVVTVLASFGAVPERALSEPGSGADKPTFAPGRILVKLEKGAPVNALGTLNGRNDASVEERLPGTEVSVVDLPQKLSVAEAARRYEASPNVEYAEPDYKIRPLSTPNDPKFSQMHALKNTGQVVDGVAGTLDADIDASEAWSVATGSSSVVVAVIDTGVDIRHSDLKDNTWTNPDETPGNGIDDDRNGYVDDIHGWDFRNDDNSVFDTATDDAHGTHVAGTIAASGNNGVGVTGVSWEAKVMSLKFIGGESGYTSDAIAALEYAVSEGVKISNNSWGGGGYSQALKDEIDKADAAGHLFVASAGNEAADTDANLQYPASYDSSNVISVANTNNKDLMRYTSNYGATSVDLAAPGTWIYSTLPGNTYGYRSGTSMAAPHVSGAAALVKSQNTALDDAEIKAKLLNSVDKKTGLDGKVLTGGRLNAARAVGADTTRPTVFAVSPTGGIRDRTPIVAATMRDDLTDLAKSNIRFYLNGRQKSTFSYSSATDRLHYRSEKLPYGSHKVRISAEDTAGNVGDKSWTFRVVRP